MLMLWGKADVSLFPNFVYYYSFRQVADAIGEKCASAVRATTAAFEAALSSGNVRAVVVVVVVVVVLAPYLFSSIISQGAEAKSLFGVDEGMYDADFFYMLAGNKYYYYYYYYYYDHLFLTVPLPLPTTTTTTTTTRFGRDGGSIQQQGHPL